MILQSLKFPIGEFDKPVIITKEITEKWIAEINLFPTELAQIVQGLTLEQLHWKYRHDGWSIQQVVHHCADSHMNSFIRFKLTLTEESPVIRPYFEDKWAELPDTLEVNVTESLKILEGLHARWSVLLDALSDSDLAKEFVHPEHGKRFSIAENIGIYAWHCNHHLAHVIQAIKCRGEFN